MSILSDELSEHDWIVRAQSGDKAAYGQLVQRYRRLLVSVAYHQGLDMSAAEDAAQEAFIKAWLALPRFRESGSGLRAWLCRIAVNVALDVQRRSRPVQTLEEDIADQANNPARLVEANLARQAVRRALKQLPPSSRTALILREYEGLSYAEIAAALDIPLGTVMSRLNYARRCLREQLTGMGYGTDENDELTDTQHS